MKPKNNINDYNYIGSNTDVSRVRKLSVSINEVPIVSETISDIQINYGNISKGVLVFIDDSSLHELMPLTAGGYVSILINDITDSSDKGAWKHVFIITKVNTTRYKNGSAKHTVQFEESAITLLKRLYVSRSFTKMKFLEMIIEIFKDNEVDCSIYIDDNDPIYDNYVFPKNISMWDFLQIQMKYEGIKMYFDRDGMKIASRKILGSKNIKEYLGGDFYFNVTKDNSLPMNTILEYSGTSAHPDIFNKIASTNVNRFDVFSLKFQEDYIGLKKAYEDEELNGHMGMGELKPWDVFLTSGIKSADVLNSNQMVGTFEDFRDIITKNQNINIVIKGTTTIKMYANIKLVLPRPMMFRTGGDDKTFSARYIVKGVVDKVISGVFIQVLNLESVDYLKGDESVW
jgi:hypothetical protein